MEGDSPSATSGQMYTVSYSSGHEGLSSDYLVNDIYNNGGVFTPETQSDLSALLDIDEIGYSLVIGSFEVPRR